MKNRIVFSTDPNFTNDQDIEDKIQVLKPNQQNLRIWLEKRPGNKTVSIIRGFVGTEDELKNITNMIKKQCGVGGSVKTGEIIVQTRDRDKLLKILTDFGYLVKLSGG